MKMTRSKLKGLVKECLVEILAEGIGSSGEDAREVRAETRAKAARERVKREEARLAEHRRKFETRIDATVSNLTDNDIMRDILADTARTTLQEQASYDSNGASSGPGLDIDDIFDKTAANWATLAFSDKKTS